MLFLPMNYKKRRQSTLKCPQNNAVTQSAFPRPFSPDFVPFLLFPPLGFVPFLTFCPRFSKKVLKSFAGIEKVRTFALAFRKGGQKRDL